MPLQPPTYFGLLDTTNPVGTDSRTISDDYHRMIQESCKMQASNWAGAITATHLDVNLLTGIEAAGGKLMVGVGLETIIYTFNATAPPFWTFYEADTEIRQLVVGPLGSPPFTGGEIGGTDDPNDTTYPLNTTVAVSTISLAGQVDGHALTQAELPAVGVTFDVYNTDAGASTLARAGTGGVGGTVTTNNLGSGNSHPHGVSGVTGTGSGSGTGNLQIRPRWARGILIRLD